MLMLQKILPMWVTSEVLPKKWGAQYTLVGGDGVELEECPGTEGLLDFIANLACVYAIYACL